MKKLFLLILVLSVLFISCSKKENKQLKLSTNSWIGYAPLFYANEMGYLDKLNIKLIHNISLSESTKIYSIAKADMITTTQHEYYSLKKSGHDILPILLLDKSDGGDLILSNRTIKQLKKSNKIYLYLEIDSINSEIAQDFIKINNIDISKIEFINQNQAQIEEMKANSKKDIVVITYVPYNYKLQQHGFHQIASTKDLNSIIVIDSVCADAQTIANNKERFKELKKVIDRSIIEIESNKMKSYQILKSYLENISYEDYLDSFKLIKWINNPSDELLKTIEPMGYSKDTIIK